MRSVEDDIKKAFEAILYRKRTISVQKVDETKDGSRQIPKRGPKPGLNIKFESFLILRNFANGW